MSQGEMKILSASHKELPVLSRTPRTPKPEATLGDTMETA